MNTPESAEIIKRFYQAFDILLSTKEIRYTRNFTDKYNIVRPHFLYSKKNPDSKVFQLSWLSILIRDYGVSSQWLMTGNGEMFVRDKFTKASSPSQP